MRDLAEELHCDYAFILGEYLGDGWLDVHSPRSQRLLIVQDNRYQHSIEEIRRSLQRLFPKKNITCREVPGAGCTHIGVSHRSLLKLFPQHGPGKKHQRKIALRRWQRQIVEAHPKAFLKGLLWSDGCRFTNRQVHNGKVYEYPSYSFSNRSLDIIELFEWVCSLIQISQAPRLQANSSTSFIVRICQRDSVRRVDKFVGPKTGASTEEYWDLRRQTAPKETRCTCGALISRNATTCRPCRPTPKPTYKIDWPSDTTLLHMLSQSNYSAVARQLGVSDNAIRKRLRSRALVADK